MAVRRCFPGVPSALLVAVMLVGCSPPTMRDVNLRPSKYYQEKLKLKGRITRTQSVGSDTLIEIADQHENRILVRTNRPVTAGIGDWVVVKGVLVPEAQVGDTPLYDVIFAEEVSPSRRPWLPNIM